MNDLTVVLAALAEKLGVGVEQLYGVMIKQARIDFIITTIQYIAMFMVAKLLYKKIKTAEDFGEVEGVLLILASIVTGVTVLIGFFYLSTYAASLFNPEYWAISNIIGKVSQ